MVGILTIVFYNILVVRIVQYNSTNIVLVIEIVKIPAITNFKLKSSYTLYRSAARILLKSAHIHAQCGTT